MRRFALLLLLIVIPTVFMEAAFAQPAVERLERQLRGRKADEARPDNTGYLGVVADDRAGGARGVEVMEVMAASPALKGGLEVGDLVVKVGDRPIRDLDDFAAALEDQPVGKTLRFAIERQGEPMQLDVTLGSRPPKEDRRFSNFGRIDGGADAPPRMNLLGVRVEAVDPRTAAAAGAPEVRGAYVVSIAPDSPAALAGIPVSAVIVGFGEQEVREPADLKQAIAASRPGQQVKVDYYIRGRLLEKSVRLAEIQPDEQGGAADVPDEEPVRVPRLSSDRERIEQLEHRVQQLEARLAQMERMLGGR